MSSSENQIIVYQPSVTVRLDVRLENVANVIVLPFINSQFPVEEAAFAAEVVE